MLSSPSMHYLLLLTGCICGLTANANNATISIHGDQRCIHSNGLPDHNTGQFPNKGNPNSISQQTIRYCFALNPSKNAKSKIQHGSIGVALNGITIRPGTADYWDASSQRGFSRNRRSGWNLEGLGSRDALGMDQNNAHVDNTGLYHYHGIANALLASTAEHGSIIGYAADGFEIHYSPSQQSSYRLKTGTRPSGPKGIYDGSYNEDWEYIAGSGSLGICNEGQLNGKLVYFATQNYPYFPRCLWGNASADFAQGAQRSGTRLPEKQLHEKSTRPSDKQNKHGSNNRGHRHDPPIEAINACAQTSSGQSCSFTARNRSIEGRCLIVPSGEKACVPRRHQ